MEKCRILLVGDNNFDMYAKAFYTSWKDLGYVDIEWFAPNEYIDSRKEQGGKLCQFFCKAENKLAIGPTVRQINNALIKKVEEYVPDLVFLYSPRLIYADTVRKMKAKGSKIFIYNNDDPFANFYPKYFWRHYRKSLKFVDVSFVYRIKNVEECRAAGVQHVELLRSYYMKKRNYYIENPLTKVPAVVFLGHYEQDERGEYIKRLLDEKVTVGITKSTWENFEEGNANLIKLDNCHEKYNELMNAAKIAIVFLSKINHDTYTRRCFEIPATKTLMVAPYTEDIAAMFEDGKEVVLYRNEQEFVEKIQYYLEHEDERIQIANAGYERLMRDGHEAEDRVRQVMRAYERICEEKE